VDVNTLAQRKAGAAMRREMGVRFMVWRVRFSSCRCVSPDSTDCQQRRRTVIIPMCERGKDFTERSHCFTQGVSSLLRANATRKPSTVRRPANSCATSNASGIIVSANIARMAPAAVAVVAATTSGEKTRNTA
jgi:hypothetical protein